MFWSGCLARRRLFQVLPALMVVAGLVSLLHSAAAEPNKILASKNPQALSLGITFHPDVSNDIRKAIVEDLSWLSTIGPIKDERLRHLLQIDEPMTGASVVAWFLDRVHVIGVFGWCPPTDYVDITFNESGPVVAKRRARCAPESAEWRAAVPRTAFSGLPSGMVRGIGLDRRIRIVPETWPAEFRWPVMKIAPDFLRSGATASARVGRLGTLFHEASHVDGISHEGCKQSDWKFLAFTLGPWKYPSPFFNLGNPNCDDPVGGSAFTIQGSLLRAMADYCHCTSKEQLTIRANEWAIWRYQGVPLKEPTVIPSLPELKSIKGLAGATLSNFPPAEFFEAGIKYTEIFLRLCQNRCREFDRIKGWQTELAGLRKFGNSLSERGAFTGSWQSSNPKRPPIKRPLDIAGAKKWLAAAAKAAKNGYNVETTSLVSCADLQNQC